MERADTFHRFCRDAVANQEVRSSDHEREYAERSERPDVIRNVREMITRRLSSSSSTKEENNPVKPVKPEPCYASRTAKRESMPERDENDGGRSARASCRPHTMKHERTFRTKKTLDS